jgi:hypothetical protein
MAHASQQLRIFDSKFAKGESVDFRAVGEMGVAWSDAPVTY